MCVCMCACVCAYMRVCVQTIPRRWAVGTTYILIDNYCTRKFCCDLSWLENVVEKLSVKADLAIYSSVVTVCVWIALECSSYIIETIKWISVIVPIRMVFYKPIHIFICVSLYGCWPTLPSLGLCRLCRHNLGHNGH